MRQDLHNIPVLFSLHTGMAAKVEPHTRKIEIFGPPQQPHPPISLLQNGGIDCSQLGKPVHYVQKDSQDLDVQGIVAKDCVVVACRCSCSREGG